MGGEEFVQTRQLAGRGPHEVDAGAAVHVNVNETGRQDGLGKGVVCKIDHLRILRNFPLGTRGDGGDEAVLNKEERVFYFFLRRIETISREHDHIAFASTGVKSLAGSITTVRHQFSAKDGLGE